MKVGQTESGVPLPETTGKYGFVDRMGNGDSVVITLGEDDKLKAVKAGIRSAASRIGSRVVFLDNGDGSLRVWRLERPAAKTPRKKRGKKGEADGGL